MTHARLVLALALLSVSASPALARQDEPIVKLGDGVVDGSFIKPYACRWKLVGRGKDGSVKEMGTWSDDVRIETRDGKPVLRRRQVWNYGQGTEGYFNLVDQKTLAPILSHYTNTPGLYYRFEYHDGGVRYQRSPLAMTEPMTQGDVKPSMPVFEFNAGMFGLLIACFPLAEDYEARFPVFPTFSPAAEPAWVDLHVEGREKVTVASGKEIECWRVIVNSPATDEVMRFDLTREPPYVVRLQQE